MGQKGTPMFHERNRRSSSVPRKEEKPSPYLIGGGSGAAAGKGRKLREEWKGVNDASMQPGGSIAKAAAAGAKNEMLASAAEPTAPSATKARGVGAGESAEASPNKRRPLGRKR